MWVFFGSFFMSYLEFNNKTRVAFAHLRTLKHLQNWIENWISLDSVMDFGSAFLLISLLDTWVLSMAFTIECRVVINI